MTTTRAKPRWARGFFRAWLALAVVWLSLVSVVTYSDYPTEESLSFEARTDDGGHVTKERLLAAADKAKAAGDMDSETRLRAAAEEMASLAERKATVVQRGAAFASIPPMVLLVLGLLVAWVLRGFRAGDAA